MGKILNWIKLRLPISKKEYLEFITNINEIISGLIQEDKQHSQIEMNLIKNMDSLTLANQTKKAKSINRKEMDPAFN